MRHARALGELFLGGLDIVEEFEPLKERVVLTDIEEHGSATPVLSEHDRPPRPLHTANDGSELRSELGQGLDVCGETRYGHEDLRECVQNSVHIAALARKLSVAA
jgi:hypothetical protein